MYAHLPQLAVLYSKQKKYFCSCVWGLWSIQHIESQDYLGIYCFPPNMRKEGVNISWKERLKQQLQLQSAYKSSICLSRILADILQDSRLICWGLQFATFHHSCTVTKIRNMYFPNSPCETFLLTITFTNSKKKVHSLCAQWIHHR